MLNRMHRAFTRAIRAAFNERGVIDLGSIMVGVLVLGIVGAVISATVFAVVPWSQDQAARESLSSIEVGQSAVRVYDDVRPTGHGADATDEDAASPDRSPVPSSS